MAARQIFRPTFLPYSGVCDILCHCLLSLKLEVMSDRGNIAYARIAPLPPDLKYWAILQIQCTKKNY